MSLFLGIFNKRGNTIDPDDFREVLDEFDYQGERGIHTVIHKNLLIATARAAYESPNVALSTDGTYTCVIGGEIHDTSRSIADLKSKRHVFQDEMNQAEFIINSYREYPHSLCADFTGTFGFILLDGTKQELILGNDAFGIYPVFIYDTDDLLIACSEWEPIIQYRYFDFLLDHDAIAEFYTLGLPIGDKTFFKQIKNLSPATLMRLTKRDQISDGPSYSVHYEQYDDHSYRTDHQHDITYFAERIARLVHTAVQRRVKNPEILQADLTGGADSRLLLGNLTAEQRSAITFYTYGTKWTPDDQNQELIISKMLTEKYGLNHKIESRFGNPEKPFDENWFNIRRIVFSDKKRLSAGVSFSDWILTRPPLNPGNANRREITSRLRHFFTREFRRTIRHPYDTYRNGINEVKAENKLHLFNLFHANRGFFTTMAGGTRAGWHDPYTHYLRSDSFFWDQDLLKYLMTIPEEMFLKRKLYLEHYRNHHDHLLDIPTTRKDLNPIQVGVNPVVKRKPDYQTALNRILQTNDVWEKDLYNRKFVEALVKKDPEASFTKAFIDFEIWCRRFIKQK